MATKLGDLTVAATTGAWTLNDVAMTAGSKTVTLRRKSDGAVLATRSFTVSAPSGITYVGAGAAYSATLFGANTATLGVPSGIQSGDILVLGFGGGYASNSDPVSGWTVASTYTGSGYSSAQWAWKRAAGNETSVAVSVLADDGEGEINAAYRGRIYAFRGCVASGSPLDASVGTASATGTTVTGSALTTATANAMIVMLGGGYAGTETYGSPSGSVDTVVGATGQFIAYDDAPSNSAGAKSSPVVTASASASWTAITLALKPA